MQLQQLADNLATAIQALDAELMERLAGVDQTSY
jgi:hypothetical protein